MPPASEVLTLCFHTRDAVERDDSSMTFEMPGGQLRTEAARVALASCEFPMVQWTVEEDWSRLYLNEGVRLEGPVEARTLSLLVGAERADLVLPPRLAAAQCAGDRRRLVVECGAPHGLFSEATREPNRAAVEDGGVHLLGGAEGDVAVRAAAELEYVSATAFALVGAAAARAAGGAGARYVLVPPPASPARLCEWLTHAARGAVAGARLTLRYDAGADRVRLAATAAAAEEGGAARAPPTPARVLPSALARRLGLSTAAQRVPPPPAPPTEWPCEATGLWDYVELPPGFYGPCHRPMCTGQPLRLGAELEGAVNRLYFPLGAPTAASPVSPHALVFADPDGHVHACPIPSGRYTPERLCAHLEAGMAAAAGGGLSFAVSHFEDRFSFACERALPGGAGVVPAPFGLLWHHPLSVDPARFGFAAQPLAGADTYVAPQRTRVARVDGGGAHPRAAANVVRVAEVGAQKRFSLHGVAPPALVGVLDAASALGRPVLRTHLSGRPFAHGLQPGDVVGIGAPAAAAAGGAAGATVADGADGAEREAPAAPVDWPRGGAPCSCVVLAPLPGDDVHVLRLDAPRLGGLADAGACVQVACRAEPWNLCFGRPRSVPAHLLGFARGAVQWGVDGSVQDAEGRRMPPFVAPHTHCLDHPDYVLMTLSESSGAALEHSYDGENRHVFCKLSLYPLFREERMLPRDTSLLRGNLSRFTLAFWNPDLRTPYRFHGAEFSFSLNFVSVLE